MIFLHFRPLDELDLMGLTGTSEITVVVPRVTLRELDKHKSTHQHRRIRERARRVLADIEAAIENGTQLKGDVKVVYFPDHPTDLLRSMDLNPEWADDVLVASIAAFQSQHGGDSALLTQDTGPRLTCHHHGIRTFKLNDKYALKDEPNETEKTNRELQLKVQRLQNAMPRLEAVFAGSTKPENVARFELSPQDPFDESRVDGILDRLRQAYPKMDVPPEKKQTLTGLAAAAALSQVQFDMHSVSREQIQSYNRRLETYFNEYVAFLRDLHRFREPDCCTITFQVEIRNTGTAPADDVDVLLNFPDGFELLSEDELSEEPKPPRAPSKPKSGFAELTGGLDLHRHLIQPSFPKFNPPSSFQIEQSNSYNVTDHFSRIKHGIPAALPKLCATFPTLDDAQPFKCTYEIRPANLADPVIGELHFVVSHTAAG